MIVRKDWLWLIGRWLTYFPFEFEFLLIESIPTNLLLRGHNIRLRCGSKAGPDVRAFRERTGHRSLSCNLESCLALCTGPPYVSDRDVRGETRKNSCHFALAASGAGTIVVRTTRITIQTTLRRRPISFNEPRRHLRNVQRG